MPRLLARLHTRSRTSAWNRFQLKYIYVIIRCIESAKQKIERSFCTIAVTFHFYMGSTNVGGIEMAFGQMAFLLNIRMVGGSVVDLN